MPSNPKKAIFNQKARYKVYEGIDLFIHPIAPFVGKQKPHSYNQLKIKDPKMIDGIDEYQLIGYQLAQNLYLELNEQFSNGASAAVILFRELIKQGCEKLNKGVLAHDLKVGLKKALDCVIDKILSISTTMASPTDAIRVALTATKENKEIGQIIFDASSALLPHGLMYQSSPTSGVTLIETTQGIFLNWGYLNSYFAPSQDSKDSAIIDCHILITEKPIKNIHDILHILRFCAKNKKRLLIVAKDINKDVISTLILNKITNISEVYIIKVPSTLDQSDSTLQILADSTGSKLVKDTKNICLANQKKDILGFSKEILLSKNHSIIICDNLKLNTREFINKNGINNNKLLIGYFAKINLGSSGDMLYSIKSDLLAKAIHAYNSTIFRGYIPGGGIGLFHAGKKLHTYNVKNSEKHGFEILQETCKSILCQIMANSTMDQADNGHSIFKSSDFTGINLSTGAIENFATSKIIDSSEVVIESLKSAYKYSLKVLFMDALFAEDTSGQGFL